MIKGVGEKLEGGDAGGLDQSTLYACTKLSNKCNAACEQTQVEKSHVHLYTCRTNSGKVQHHLTIKRWGGGEIGIEETFPRIKIISNKAVPTLL